MSNDAAAKPLLRQVMTAAGNHDRDRVLEHLAAAENELGRGRHKARTPIEAARAAAVAGEWPAVWRHAHQAMCDLTWTSPDDPGMCPPLPTAIPFTEQATVCGCGSPLPFGAKFCPLCGTPTASRQPTTQGTAQVAGEEA